MIRQSLGYSSSWPGWFNTKKWPLHGGPFGLKFRPHMAETWYIFTIKPFCFIVIVIVIKTSILGTINWTVDIPIWLGYWDDNLWIPMRRWFIGSRAWSLSYAAPWRPKKVSEDVGFTRFTMGFTMDFHINLWLFLGEHGKSLSIIYHGIFTSMSFSWGNMRFLTMTFG